MYYSCDMYQLHEKRDNVTVAEKEQWITLTVAAGRIGISQSKLSLMAKKGEIRSKKDPRDKRKTFVEWRELQKIFFPEE
jgi:hypothetical protein